MSIKVTPARTGSIAGLVSNAGSAGNVITDHGGLTGLADDDHPQYTTDAEVNALIAAAGSAGVTVEDEGTPLATLATTLDFVGAGVTATGAGATKTITIPGAAASVLPFLFATDYGAVPDNTTNNDAALAAWVAAGIAAGGAIMVLPVGTCKITVALAVSPGAACVLHFLGAGEFPTGSRIRQATANTSGITFNGNARGSVLENLWVEGPTGGSSGSGISGDIYTIGVRTVGFYNGLSLPADAFYSKHWKSWFYNAVNACVLIAAGANNFDFVACYVHTGTYGYDIGGALSGKITGGAVEQCGTAGIRANGGTNAAGLSVSGIYFENPDGVTDILLGDVSLVQGTTITGCTHVRSAYTGTGWAVHGVRADNLSINGGSIDSSQAIWIETYPATIIKPWLRNAGTMTLVAGCIVFDPPDIIADVGGDLDGALPNPAVVGFQGFPMAATAPTLGQAIVWDGATWLPGDVAASGGGGELLIASAPSTPLVFADIVQNSAQDDFVYSS